MKNQWNIKQEPKGSSIGCVDLSIVSKNYYNIVPLTKVIARKIWERGNIVNKTKCNLVIDLKHFEVKSKPQRW